MIKQIVCFANSRKPHGKCFAGKDIEDKTWIRPISNRGSESLDIDEECIRGNNCKCIRCNPIIPALLDVVEVELEEYAGDAHQVENYIIGDLKWKKIGELNTEYVDQFLDSCTGGLWVDGFGTWHRKNDRVPVSMGSFLNDSLKLIEVKKLILQVVVEGLDFGNPRKKVNGIFLYNGNEYIIPVTDEVIERKYLQLVEGNYSFSTSEKRILLCLSMGKEYKGYIYKFIAGVISI